MGGQDQGGKKKGEEMVRQYALQGRDTDRVVPHPKNFFSNDWTRQHGIAGRLDPEQAALERKYLFERNEAEWDIQRHVARYREAESDEERVSIRAAIDEARSRWLHYNSKVGLRDWLFTDIPWAWAPDKPVRESTCDDPDF